MEGEQAEEGGGALLGVVLVEVEEELLHPLDHHVAVVGPALPDLRQHERAAALPQLRHHDVAQVVDVHRLVALVELVAEVVRRALHRHVVHHPAPRPCPFSPAGATTPCHVELC